MTYYEPILYFRLTLLIIINYAQDHKYCLHSFHRLFVNKNNKEKTEQTVV